MSLISTSTSAWLRPALVVLTLSTAPAAAPAAGPQAGELYTDPATGIAFRYIPAGTFPMGSPADEPGRFDNEVRHPATLTRGTWLGETEVTQGQWQQLMGNNAAFHQGCGADCPVERVTWFDAAAFANALSRRAGLPECYQLQACEGQPGEGLACDEVVSQGADCKGYRLPTEAEWERAVRAGTETALYTGPITLKDDTSPQLDPIAWYAANSLFATNKVGQKQANAWHLRDMLGNVGEWCHDWDSPYPNTPTTDPQGPTTGSQRVIRGGSFYTHARYLRSAYRAAGPPAARGANLGFRVARTAP